MFSFASNVPVLILQIFASQVKLVKKAKCQEMEICCTACNYVKCNWFKRRLGAPGTRTIGARILTKSRTAPKRRGSSSYRERLGATSCRCCCPGNSGGGSWSTSVRHSDGHGWFFWLQQSQYEGQGPCLSHVQDVSRQTGPPPSPPSPPSSSKLPCRFNGCATLQLWSPRGNFCIVTIEVSNCRCIHCFE